MNKMYSGELSFLNYSRSGVEANIRSAEWLHCDFYENKWDISFNGDVSRTVDFGVVLHDGSLLTATHHRQLLDALKSWLCAQTHPSSNGGRRFSPDTQKNRVFQTLHIIDLLLLNQDKIDLVNHGLEAITRNDLVGLVASLCQHSDIGIAVYQWPSRLRDYLLHASADLTADALTRAIDELPSIDLPYEGDDAMLNLDRSQLLQVRAWLWHRDLYSRQRRNEDCYRPDIIYLTEEIYRQTLWGAQSRVAPPELLIAAGDSTAIEKRRVPVRNFEDERPDQRKINAYLACLSRLSYVVDNKVSLGADALRHALQAGLQAFVLKESGRTKTLPESVVMLAVRRAVDFVLSHGPVLTATYTNVAQAVAARGISLGKFLQNEKFLDFVPTEAIALGIQSWSISPFGINTSKNSSSREYFRKLRANYGLCELLKVLMASIWIVVGTLMARRGGEMHDLREGRSLDASGRYLIFANRKSGEYVHRMDEARPIPKVAANMLRMLERLHVQLKPLGFAEDESPLLAAPARLKGALASSAAASASALDMFCDYFELPGDDEHSRYYIRQHQLRRFFAIAFFWGSGFGGLDTLRWFLGHMDPRHIWHYVTENTPGEVLRDVKVEYAKGQVLSSAPEADALADVLAERFGTRNFALVGASQLSEYVDSLIGDGTVTVEPPFITTPGGERYNILIKVTGQEVGT